MIELADTQNPGRPRRPIKAALIVAVLTLTSSFASAQEIAGESASEDFQDWRLRCSEPVEGADQSCLLQQEQSRQNGERLLIVEISQRPDGGTHGSILLPFGILFDRGARLRVDDNASMEPVPFRTCLPNGCVATFDISQTMLAQMRMGVNLTVQITTVNGQEMRFPISLSGFTAATNRLADISRPQ